MGKITEAQRKWLEGLGVDLSAAGPSAVAAPSQPAAPASDAPLSDQVFSPTVATPVDLRMDSPAQLALMRKFVGELAEKDKQEAERKLVTVNRALVEVRAYIAAMPAGDLHKGGYADVMEVVRKRFPEAAGLSQWVQETSVKVPELKGKLPSPKALMDVVQSAVQARGGLLGMASSVVGDPRSANIDRLRAAYMSELPSGVTVRIKDGVVQLAIEGSAQPVTAPPPDDVEASAGKGGASVALTKGDYSIRVVNDGWKQFDPELRAQWKQIDDELSTALNLKVTRDKAKLELEHAEKNGAMVTTKLSADHQKREAEFELVWTELQEQIKVTAAASEKKIAAGVAYLKKDAKDKVAVKAGVDAEVDLQAMRGTLKAYYASPTIEAALEVTAAADKVTAKLELAAVKGGVVVTASFEKALDETKGAIEILLRDGKTKVAAELRQKADELTAKLKVVHETKDLKLAAELEKTLKDVRGTIEVAYTKGQATVKGGASGSSSGEVGGKVQIDIALGKGCAISSSGDKLSFTANVSNDGYKFEVAFSMGQPVAVESLQDVFASADRQIRELYKLAGDKGVRSITDVQALNQKLQDVMAPIKKAAAQAKALKKKSEIAASFGFSIEGEWPSGGKAMPPAAYFGATITF